MGEASPGFNEVIKAQGLIVSAAPRHVKVGWICSINLKVDQMWRCFGNLPGFVKFFPTGGKSGKSVVWVSQSRMNLFFVCVRSWKIDLILTGWPLKCTSFRKGLHSIPQDRWNHSNWQESCHASPKFERKQRKECQEQTVYRVKTGALRLLNYDLQPQIKVGDTWCMIYIYIYTYVICNF